MTSETAPKHEEPAGSEDPKPQIDAGFEHFFNSPLNILVNPQGR